MTEAETKWVTDAELIRRLGVPEKIARQTLRELDRNPASGFPKKSKIWGERRYWPAVLDPSIRVKHKPLICLRFVSG